MLQNCSTCLHAICCAVPPVVLECQVVPSADEPPRAFPPAGQKTHSGLRHSLGHSGWSYSTQPTTQPRRRRVHHAQRCCHPSSRVARAPPPRHVTAVVSHRRHATTTTTTAATSTSWSRGAQQVLQNLDLVEDRTKLILAEQERDLLRAFRARLFDKQVQAARRRRLAVVVSLAVVSRGRLSRLNTNRRATTKRHNTTKQTRTT